MKDQRQSPSHHVALLMSTKLKRVSFHAPDEIVKWLTAESERTGVLVSEILRRLVKEEMEPKTGYELILQNAEDRGELKRP